MCSFCPVFNRGPLSLSYHCPDRRDRKWTITTSPILFVHFYDAPEWIPFTEPREPSPLFLFFFTLLMKLLMLTLDGACRTTLCFVCEKLSIDRFHREYIGWIGLGLSSGRVQIFYDTEFTDVQVVQ